MDAALVTLLTQLIASLTGPGGALVLVAIVIGGMFYIAIKHIFPAHKEQMEKITPTFQTAIQAQSDEHREDRKAFAEGLKEVSAEISKMSVAIDNQNIKIEKLHGVLIDRTSSNPNYTREDANLI